MGTVSGYVFCTKRVVFVNQKKNLLAKIRQLLEGLPVMRRGLVWLGFVQRASGLIGRPGGKRAMMQNKVLGEQEC